jgi:uncharacterized protein (TIGR03067 family)
MEGNQPYGGTTRDNPMPSNRKDAASVLNAINGRWHCIYSELDGTASPEAAFANSVLEYSENTFKVEKAGVVAHEGTFTINTSSDPCGLVYIYSKSTIPIYLGGPRLGILQIEGDTLKTCLSALGYPAPRDFNTFLDSDSVLTIFRRSQPKHVVEALAPGALVASRSRAVYLW